jgi:hypothetical protein
MEGHVRRRIGIGAAILAVLLAVWWLLPRPGQGSGAGLTERSSRRAVGGPDHPASEGAEPRADLPDGAASADGAAPGGDPLADEPTDEQLAARARALANSPDTHVICNLGIPVRSGKAYLAIGGHSDGNGRIVEVIDGVAYLPLVYDLGSSGDATFDARSGVFALEGYGPGKIAWSDRPEGGGKGRCLATIQPELGRASLTGTLTLARSGAPAAGGWIEGCGNLAFADADGIVHMDIVDSPCTVVAMRQDGALRSVSEPANVTPIPGSDVVLDLTLPDAPKAGLGIQIAEAEGGIEIQGVVDGGPAQAAGLEAGDLVVQVDGQAADELTLPEFVSLAAGPAGSQVVLGVERDGRRLDIAVVRAPVPTG